jgi:membrane protein implicated in regulation of membrane protease activity
MSRKRDSLLRLDLWLILACSVIAVLGILHLWPYVIALAVLGFLALLVVRPVRRSIRDDADSDDNGGSC